MRTILSTALAVLLLAAPAHATVTIQPGSSVLSGAQAAAASDGRLVLSPGVYASETWTNFAPAQPVTITGPGAVLGYMNLKGVRDVTFDGLTFSAGIDEQSVSGINGPTMRVAVLHSSISSTDPWGVCVRVWNRATDITFRGNRIYHCRAGIAMPGRPTILPTTGTQLTSHNVTIAENVIEDMQADGVQVSDVAGFTFEKNVITDIHDDGPCGHAGERGCEHNDGLQAAGGVSGAVVRGNSITDTGAQLILWQGGTGDRNDGQHLNDGLTFQANVGYDVPGVLVQSQGTTNAAFRHNVLCGYDNASIDGGLWLRAWGGIAPLDTIVDHNILYSYAEMEGAHAAQNTGNIVGC